MADPVVSFDVKGYERFWILVGISFGCAYFALLSVVLWVVVTRPILDAVRGLRP